jgi:hypothetical protein
LPDKSAKRVFALDDPAIHRLRRLVDARIKSPVMTVECDIASPIDDGVPASAFLATGLDTVLFVATIIK